ncbi:hypothetical protein CKO35_17265 [Ectothiorhodospira shaposhnikovii]|uniref:hypothetical protein n=1 Tax=Ectothiorhodospira shaposhnikovii TaxID=1054 RepID=UPI001904BFF2|nr:hypothetical protein [Ectothiorhodospira shaposhnikovii]MBK1674990.1 hypothetical protein [Ectothiorhodospira shaposhnikovii]
MQSTKTYTKRENARRAAIAAGVPAEQVEITVHKNGDEVRFGWKRTQPPHSGEQGAASTVTAAATEKRPQPAHSGPSPKVQREERNGVKRPAPGGACAAVWEYLDANPTTAVKELRELAPAKDWNVNNAVCELYTWRKFNGIRGRQKVSA